MMTKGYLNRNAVLILITLSLGLFFTECQDDILNSAVDNDSSLKKMRIEQSDSTVTLMWNQNKQVIDGFGVAQAGWSDQLYKNRSRSEIMEWLFGEKGLRLSILRGEIFPHFSKKKGERNFATDENIDIPLDDPFFKPYSSEDMLRRGQLWICREARQKYHVDKLIFSAWTPPAYMKINNSTSGGSLLLWEYKNYADYLVDFIKAYQKFGLNVYAISPANEPEYAANWNSCLWWPGILSLGPFIRYDLGPAIRDAGLNTKIIFGENAQWSTFALIMGSKLYVQSILALVPGIKQFNVIAAGHGYVDPIDQSRISIVPYEKAESNNIHVWLTEVSSIDALDTSMQNALNWAADFHRYLNDADANALVWWVGAQPTTNNESLIVLNKDNIHYSFTKRYETFGNFSRYIKVGSTRIMVNRAKVMPADMHITAYKHGDEYVIVTVNNTTKDVKSKVAFDSNQKIIDMKRIITDATHRWQESNVKSCSDGNFIIDVPAKSVVTFTGSIKQ